MKVGINHKEQLREAATAAFASRGISFTTHNMGNHMVVEGEIDFWPTTGKFYHRPSKVKGSGLNNVLAIASDILSGKHHRPIIRPITADKLQLVPQKYPRSGELWTEEELQQLRVEFDEGVTIVQMCRLHERSPAAVVSILENMGRVVNKNGRVYRLIFWGTV